jgi:hypothetical protein
VTGTGSGPAFPNFVNFIRVTGTGGDNVLPQSSVVDDSSNLRKSNYIFAPLSSATWDNATDLRSITLKGTSDPLDPNKLTITRVTAQISDVVVGTGSVPTLGVVPVYYMASIGNGSISYSDTTAGSGTATFPANQSLELLGWGYTGDLFGTRNSFPTISTIGNTTGFGTVVVFDLENATKPAWTGPVGANPTTSPPGTFDGTFSKVAVAIGPTALYYGMIGRVNMPGFGTFTFGTNGGITNPTLSGVVGPLTGDYGRLESNTFNTFATGPASFCGAQCYADVQFDNIFLKKIGVTYFIGNTQSFGNGDTQIGGIATFAQNSAPVPSPLLTGIVSFVDPISSTFVAATNPASGMVENLPGGVALKQADLASGQTRIRGTATVADMGSVPGILSWERWTNGTFTNQFSATVTIPQDAGVSFVYGTPVSYLSHVGDPFFAPANFGPSVQYSLIGATTPTISDGSVSTSIANRAFVGSGGNTTSKLGVDFASMKVGFDMYVQIGAGFGQSIYNFATIGGAANPSSSGISFDSNGLFSTGGRTLQVSLINAVSPGDGVPSCTSAGLCKAGVTGFLSGPDATYAGLNYYFGNTTSAVPLISGAAVFGRDMPITEAAAYAFAYVPFSGSDPNFSQSAVGSANSQVSGDTTTPTGLSLKNFFINIPNNNSNGVNFFRDTAIVKEQGTLGGGFSATGSAIGSILGWERWTGGTVTTCTDNTCTNQVSRTLTADQGLHIVYGTPATNLPTSGTYNYVLAGATSPTVANGSVAPGTLQPTSTMGVTFGGANPNVSANLNVTMVNGLAQPENYNVSGTMPLNNVKFDSGGLTLSVVNTGASTLCGSGCKGSIGGFLAGPGALGLGLFYQIGTSASSPTLISGAAGFKKQ